MLKVVRFLLAGGVIIALAWLLSGVPGQFAASAGSFDIETSIPVAIVLLVALVAVIVLLLRILRGVLAIPRAGSAWRRRQRVAAGDRAITRVLVALAAGEQRTARTEARRARQLLGDSTQTLLLVAEAGRLAGREDEAEQAYHALAKRKDGRFLGLRGLLRQAVDRRDWPAAMTIAKQAEASHPRTPWLRLQRADLALRNDNWTEALELIGPDPRRPTYYVAAADAETDPARALSLARRACKQDPTFTPAVLAYASRLRAMGYEMRAQSCIAEAWKAAPHPDLAAFALAPQTDKLGRALSAARLAARNPTHPESRILLARVALDAGMIDEARHQIEVAEAEGTHQRRLCLLLAEIEEQGRGDTAAGRQAQSNALRLAATAEPDPRWQCSSCHAEQAAWHPKCPACSNVGTIKWQDSQPVRGVPVIAG